MPIKEKDRPLPPPPPPKPGLYEKMGGGRGVTASGIRALSGFLTNAGLWPGAMAGAGGEAIAQAVETAGTEKGFELNYPRIAAEGAIGAVPFNRILKAGKVVTSAARGAALAGGGSAARQATEDGGFDPRKIELEPTLASAALGGTLNAGLAKLFRPAEKVAEKAKTAGTGTAFPKPETPDFKFNRHEPTPLLKPTTTPYNEFKTGPEWSVGPAPRPATKTPQEIAAAERAQVAQGREHANLINQRLKAEEEAARLAAIEETKKGLEPQPPTVRETSSGTLPGGEKASTSRTWRAPKDGGDDLPRTRTRVIDPSDLSPENQVVYGKWRELGRPHSVALKLAAEGKEPDALTTLLTPNKLNTPRKPSTKAAKEPYQPAWKKAQAAVGATQPARAPSLTPEQMAFLQANEQAVVEAVEAGEDSVAAINRLMGEAPPAGGMNAKGELIEFVDDAPQAAPVKANPEVAPAVEEPTPLGKTLTPEGKLVDEAQQPLSPGAQRANIARSLFSPEANSRLDELAELLRSGKLSREERGPVAQELKAIQAAEEARLAHGPEVPEGFARLITPNPAAPVAGPRPISTFSNPGAIVNPATGSSQRGVAQSAAAREAAVAAAAAKRAAKAENMAPAGDWATFKEEMAAAGVTDEATLRRAWRLQGGGKKGGGTFLGSGLGAAEGLAGLIERNPAFAAKLGATVGGGVTGALWDPLDNPLASGLAGAAAGAGLANANPETVKKAWGALPNIQRSNLLFDPVSLLANAGAGPYGGGVMGALELWGSGNPLGKEAMKEMAPIKFLKRFHESGPEASQRIHEGDLGRAEQSSMDIFNPKVRDVLEAPARFMTQGDLALKKGYEAAGLPKEVGDRFSLTSEPEQNPFRWFANAGKDSVLAGLAVPFKRTFANIAEQGLQRFPGVGFAMQAARDVPDPMQQQLVQQGMSLGVGAGTAAISSQLDPETSKVARKFITNSAGVYGLPAAMGWAAGEAIRSGKNPRLASGIEGIQNALPMPSTQTVEDYIRKASKWGTDAPLDEKIPRGTVPKVLYDMFIKEKPPVEGGLPEPRKFRSKL